MSSKVEKVFVSGKFRIIHAGHMRLFRTASDLGKVLIVGLDVSGLSKEEIGWRTGILSGIKYVDSVLEFTGDVSSLIREIQPDIVVKGHEFRNVHNPESALLAAYGGELVFTSGASFYSESDLIKHSDEEFLSSLLVLPQDFMARNSITTNRLIELVQAFSKLRVCVVGDLIIDEYINCHPIGMSQEEPTVVVTPVDQKRFLGGAGIVAAHSRSLGAQTALLTVTGEDEVAEWALEQARDYAIDMMSITDRTRPTTLKQRFRSGNQTLLKLSHLRHDYLETTKEHELLSRFRELLPNLDVLIFSDFSYGVLSTQTVARMIELAAEHGVVVSADSQSSSQVGNLSKFEDIHLISATEREARLELRDASSGLVVVAESLRTKLGAKNVLLKLGADGVLISAEDSAGQTMATDEIGSLNKSPVDISGAGDSMLAAASLALALNANVFESALLGSVLAGIQVSRVGNVPITRHDISVMLQS